MPHYDYECKNCGYNFEVFQQITEEPLTECPKCKGSVRRLIGAGSGLIFKGSGFYVTDYKKNSGGGRSKSFSKKADKPESFKSCPSCSSKSKNSPSNQAEQKPD